MFSDRDCAKPRPCETLVLNWRQGGEILWNSKPRNFMLNPFEEKLWENINLRNIYEVFLLCYTFFGGAFRARCISAVFAILRNISLKFQTYKEPYGRKKLRLNFRCSKIRFYWWKFHRVYLDTSFIWNH